METCWLPDNLEVRVVVDLVLLPFEIAIDLLEAVARIRLLRGVATRLMPGR